MERVVEVEKPVEVIREVLGPERIVQVEVPVIREDTAKIERLTKDNSSLKLRIRDLEEEVIQKPKILEKIVEVEKTVEKIIEKAASKDLREAARLLAQSEFNKEDLSEDDIYNILLKSSDNDVKRKLGFWAVPLPKNDTDTTDTNKRYIGKK